jgi:hypothetical protein
MAVSIQLTLIIRQGCHLCDEAANDLAGVVARFSAQNPDKPYSIDVLDVDADPDRKAKFSEEVPVLLLNGEQIAFFRIDQERVLAKLEAL